MPPGRRANGTPGRDRAWRRGEDEPGPYHARRVILADVDGTRFAIELDQETDGRWIADVPALPGVLAYGATREDAIARVEALALRVLADRAGFEESRLNGAGGQAPAW
jgi:predicted RNase H-like HicB family nuclease